MRSWIKLPDSLAPVNNDILSSKILDPNEIVTATILIRKKNPDVSLAEYANGVVSGSNDLISRTDLKDIFGADLDDLDFAQLYCVDCGLDVTSRFRSSGTLYVSGPASAFNQAFNTRLISVERSTGTFRTYNGELSIPEELDGIILHVLDLDNSPALHPLYVTADPEVENLNIDDTSLNPLLSSVPLRPAQVANAYNCPQNSGAGQCVAILQFGGGYTTSDITNSFSRIGLSNPTIVDVLVNGATNNPTDTNSSVEVMLDTYVVGGTVPNAKQAIYFAPNTLGNFVNAYNAAVYDAVNNPSIISVSWGQYEAFWSSTLRNTIDGILQAAAVLGISTYIASGDYGSKATSTSSAYTVNYISPWAFGVGGTTLQLNPNGSAGNEYTWNQGTAGTGGGISSLYSVPAYQTGLTSKTYPGNVVSALSGRGIPDLSAPADPATGYQFYSNGNFYTTGGTSAAAPFWAGFTARLNAISGTRLGFAVNLFYSNPGVFNNITVGNNALTGSQGFAATAGWNACTGLGTPKGAEILNLISSATGTRWPKQNTGSRPTSGAVYPRPVVKIQ